MGQSLFARWLGTLFRGHDTLREPRLCPVPAMHAAVERERLRADRTGRPFTVIHFLPLREPWRQVAIDELLRIVQQRMRGSDLVGWWWDERVCLLLPDTPAEGGRRLVGEIHVLWSVTAAFPGWELFTYPMAGPCHEPLVTAPGAGTAAVPPVPGAEALLGEPMPWWKRTLDVAGASLGMLLLAPLLATVAMAIKLTSPGPVLFRQLRRGRGGQPFWLYKFRSMVADAEERKPELWALNECDGPAFKMTRDPRVTPLGRLLRATNIDELPQLWNVLKGEMSLVGPRPLPCDEADRCEGWQRRRLDVTPGLTCIWQVKKHRDRISFADWIRMDLRYIKGRSLRLDLKLVWQTLKLPWRRERSG